MIIKTNIPDKVQRPILKGEAWGWANASGNKWRNTSANWLPTATLNNNSKYGFSSTKEFDFYWINSIERIEILFVCSFGTTNIGRRPIRPTRADPSKALIHVS